MRSGEGAGKQRKRVREEMASMFHYQNPKKLKERVWRHNFFCLAIAEQQKCPSSEIEKEDLFRAGLGEKEICFDDMHISQENFHDKVISHFPRLKDGGGFRFLKGKVIIFSHR